MFKDAVLTKLIENTLLGQKIKNSTNVNQKKRYALDATEKNPNIEGTLAESLRDTRNAMISTNQVLSSIIALPVGESTAADGEIAAAKVGPKGEKYSTLKESITEQIERYKGISVSNIKPNMETTDIDVWINSGKNEDVEFDIPEINDSVITPTDTWSSFKIDRMTSELVATGDDEVTQHTKIHVSEEGEIVEVPDMDDFNELKDKVISLGDDIDSLNEAGIVLKDDFIRDIVNAWMDTHPESVANVADSSITINKFTKELKEYLIQSSKIKDGTIGIEKLTKELKDYLNNLTTTIPDNSIEFRNLNQEVKDYLKKIKIGNTIIPDASIGMEKINIEFRKYLKSLENSTGEPSTSINIRYETYVMRADSWDSNMKIYNFEAQYPKETYDIEIYPSDECTSEQLKAWQSANLVGSMTGNTTKSYGTLPTVDIPIIVKVVTK